MVSWDNGYRYYDDYPWYIYNGYRHRYSDYDTCNYELVDGHTNSVVETFPSYSCRIGYDRCSDRRDDLNFYENNYRYFCSEKFEYDSNYNYNYNYDEDFYHDLGEPDNYVEERDDYYDDNDDWDDDWDSDWN